MDTYEIAVVGGDGIGPEVCEATIEVLEAAVGPERTLVWKHLKAGANNFLATGVCLPDETIEACREADAILLGAAGLPGVLYEDGTEAGQDTTLRLRFELDLYANLRPIKLYEGVATPLEGRPAIDYAIVRENSEGLYASRGGGNTLRGEVASDTMLMTRKGVERIARKAAELCLQRDGAPLDGKRRVTICDKANVLRSFAFFRSVASETLLEYPEIEVDYALVDALSMYLVTRPGYYDVIVAENMFGDILSDLGAATIGGLGLADSAEIGDGHALFQGSHGSAPDIAGKGIANPVATVLSGATMFDWLGRTREDDFLVAKGAAIKSAVRRMLARGTGLTRDLGGSASMKECVAAILEEL
ncbi:MAG: isocitrate/isopropylmalate dehydrogenase family protein [Verrucomicrobiota bacterium]